MKISFMKKALHAKFSQHPDLLAVLLGTGSRKIVERNDGDAYWYVAVFNHTLIMPFFPDSPMY